MGGRLFLRGIDIGDGVARRSVCPTPSGRTGKAEKLMEILTAKYHLQPIIDHFTIALLATGVLAHMVG